jgi:sensor histidine kinase YesM
MRKSASKIERVNSVSDAEQAKSPFDLWRRVPLFWRFQLVGWVVFEFLSYPFKVVLLGGPQAAFTAIVLRDSVGFILTCAMRSVYQRTYHEEMSLARAALLVVAVSLVVGSILTILSSVLGQTITLEEQRIFGKIATLEMFLFWTSLAAAWSLLYFSIKLLRDAGNRAVRVAQAEAARREAEVKMLRAQMNPHFLFNALNTIRAGIQWPPEQLVAIIDGLAGYLRFSLAHRNDESIPIGEEFDALVDYLAVEKARFGNDLEIETLIDEDARSAEGPGTMLQPLVENAVKYGRSTSPLPLRIRIQVTAETGFLRVEVANTGAWVEPNTAESVGGVGLSNLRRRLRMAHHDRHSFDTIAENGWVIIRIWIPRKMTP